jgi:hypothetical protein
MSRNRTIKPEFCKSKTLNSISLESNLFFILLWTHCDDFGTILNSNRYLIGQCFPERLTVSEKDIDKWKKELLDKKLLVEVEFNNNSLLVVRCWEEHQKVPNPSIRNNIDMNIKIDEIKAIIKTLITDKLESNESLITDKLESKSPMSMSMIKSKSMVKGDAPSVEVSKNPDIFSNKNIPSKEYIIKRYTEIAQDIFKTDKITLNLFKCSEKAEEFYSHWVGLEGFKGHWSDKEYNGKGIDLKRTIKNHVNYIGKDKSKFNYEYMANYSVPYSDVVKEPEKQLTKEESAALIQRTKDEIKARMNHGYSGPTPPVNKKEATEGLMNFCDNFGR